MNEATRQAAPSREVTDGERRHAERSFILNRVATLLGHSPFWVWRPVRRGPRSGSGPASADAGAASRGGVPHGDAIRETFTFTAVNRPIVLFANVLADLRWNGAAGDERRTTRRAGNFRPRRL